MSTFWFSTVISMKQDVNYNDFAVFTLSLNMVFYLILISIFKAFFLAICFGGDGAGRFVQPLVISCILESPLKIELSNTCTKEHWKVLCPTKKQLKRNSVWTYFGKWVSSE